MEIRKEGIIKEALPGTMFRVEISGEGKEILGHLAGKLKINRIRVVPGDKVLLELSPDGARGRIVRRL